MTLKVGETGKIIRVAAGFDMTSNTELTLTFTLPDDTTTLKVKPDVVLGAINITDSDLGSLLANEYVEYDVEAGFLSQAGTWSVSLTYTNTGTDPDDNYIGECATFTVDSGVC